MNRSTISLAQEASAAGISSAELGAILGCDESVAQTAIHSADAPQLLRIRGEISRRSPRQGPRETKPQALARLTQETMANYGAPTDPILRMLRGQRESDRHAHDDFPPAAARRYGAILRDEVPSKPDAAHNRG